MMRKAQLRNWLQARRHDAAMLVVIFTFFASFFAWLWHDGRFIIGGDAFLYSYPLRTVAWNMLRHGFLPLWTPLVLSGYPLLAMSQIALGYPLTWGYLFLPGHVAEQVYVLAPFLLAPAFTYAYAREIGRSRGAALLAGLAFGYGGATINLLGVIGMPTNAQMWLPLLLIAIERARKKSLSRCLLGGASAYAMSVLTGYAQSFVAVGLTAVAYALCIGGSPAGGVTVERERARAAIDNTTRARRRWLGWRRWRPLLVALGAIAAGAGVAAFQILETSRAARRSVRSTLSYESFGEGSFTLPGAWRALVIPLYTERFADVTTYVPPLVLVLAGAAFVLALRQRSVARDARIWFWLGVAVLSWLLMLGPNTPLYRLVYHLPVLNQFRVPSRHAFEWTFALSILAAYGWDALGAYFRGYDRTLTSTDRREVLVALALGALAAIVGLLWWRATGPLAASNFAYDPHASWYTGTLAPRAYLGWKAVFTLLTLATLWQCLRLTEERWRKGLLLALIVLACFVEPYLMVTHWWWRYAKETARLKQPATVTRLLLQRAPSTEGRVYTRVQTAVVFAEEQATAPRLDGPNVTGLYGLHNVAGYEPLILERYSRALGNVFLDAVTPRRGFAPDSSLFAPTSHVLDILNTTYVAGYSNLDLTPQPALLKDGIEFGATDLGRELQPGATIALDCVPTAADTLALVTSLSHATALSDNMPVARIKVQTTDNRNIERELRAGADTAEWAHERPDVRSIVKHRLPSVFDSQPGDAANSFPACRYWAQLSLGAAVNVVKMEITNLTTASPLVIWKASLYDTRTGRSQPFPHYDPKRWQPVYDEARALILRNTRALPRAWLVAEAEAVDGEEALKRIRGESAREFDPRRTALVEVHPGELPQLPGGELSPESVARIVKYEANSLTVETNAPTPTLLVLSEIFYPGWEATLDGRPAPILLTDYLLRGVALPAGQHRIEMRYAAPAARSGAIISTLTLLMLGALFVYGRRARGTGPVNADRLRRQSGAKD